MFAAHGKAKYEACLTFVSRAAMEEHVKEKYGLEKTVVPVCGCRSIGKKDMAYNSSTPELTVDPETYKVTVDGEEITSKPAEKLPLTPALQPVLTRRRKRKAGRLQGILRPPVKTGKCRDE